MFWICVTVAMTWSLKAMSEIFLLLRAMRRYRRLGPNPKPASNSCWIEKRNIELVAGDRIRSGLFVACRLLLNWNEMFVPVGNACVYPKVAWPVFDWSEGTPKICRLASGVV